MSGQHLRVGVVGCGYWGSKHVRVLRSQEAVSSVVLIDSNTARSESLLAGMPGAMAFGTLGEALPHVDAVVIATPPTTHVPLALRAMDAGKHVLVEKPMATTSADACRLIDKAAESGVVLMVGHTFAYNPAVLKLRDLVQEGELGELYYLDSARLNLGLYQSDVNVIVDLAPHDISIINLVLGEAPAWVQAWGYRHAHRRFEDVAYLRLFYAGAGVSANIHVSWLDPCKVRRLTAVGSRKMVVYNDLVEERIRIHDKGVDVPQEADLTQPPMSYRHGDVVSPMIASNEPLAVEDAHFVERAMTGARPITDGAAGLAVVEVLECAEISLRRGRPVLLDEVRMRDSANNLGVNSLVAPAPRTDDSIPDLLHINGFDAARAWRDETLTTGSQRAAL